MFVRFYRARTAEEGREVDLYWADFGAPHVLLMKKGRITKELKSVPPLPGELITEFELPGLNEEQVEFITRKILKGRFLEEPGVQGKGDSVLYLLVNETLHELEKLRKIISED
ncbi:hypothetical protein [Desulfomonile tiedjei]|uniref:Uncharacterized protein n=1 Tax=Desulfomonile tiedjei (strain ATCC 49306 / DSM 6799 / DCB-1) TaxID=706587 RepID=I4CC41_DESTA|nr:hypothetical protein [Desulfomonile tiedjei]AFM27132.1 hypothetical protein Desti_4501 [Desulfomonile tiedjei DSM 6799]